MRGIIKNSLKAICYILFFFGMQVLVNLVIQFAYGFKLGIESAAKGIKLDAQAITNGLLTFVAENQNMLTLVSGVSTLLVLWLFFVIRKKKICQEAQICMFDKKKVIPIIILGVAASFLVSGAMTILPIPEELANTYATSSQSLLGGSLAVRILSVMIVAPIIEEVIFRGVVLSRLKRAMKPWVAIIVSSLFFGLLHGQLLWMIYTFALGILLGVVTERMKSVSAAIMLHMAFNSVGICVGSWVPTHTQMYIITAISLVLTVSALFWVLKKDSNINNKIEVEEYKVLIDKV